MRFYVNKQKLDSTLSIVSKGVSQKNIQPILSGIYMEATTNNCLILRSTDMEIGIECVIDAVVEEPGKIVVLGKFFVDLIKRLPNIDLFFKVLENGQIKIEYGKAELKLNCLDGSEYPSLMEFEGEVNFTMKSEYLKEGIEGALVSVSGDSSRPIFTGVLLEIVKDKINFVSSDTHRLSFISQFLNENEANYKAIVPGKALKEVANIIDKDQENIEIEISKNRIIFKSKNIKILSRLIEGNFVNYKQVIPEIFCNEFKIMRKNLLETLKRATLLTNEESKTKLNTIKIKIEETKLIVSGKSLEVGDIYEEISIFGEGEDLELGFNGKYMIEILEALKSEEISIKLTGSQSAGIIEPVLEGDEKKEILYLILPVRLQ